MAEIQLRRIGFGTMEDFENLRIEINGQPVSPQISPTEDLITFKFDQTAVLVQDKLSVLNMTTDISAVASSGHSHRFVLFLPNWLNANTNEKIGLFPFGGSDIEIK